MEHSFSINWGEVSGGGGLSANRKIYALWPAPVNEDACFAEAGVTHFKYEDKNWSEPHWDKQADILQQRLIELLSSLGAPALLSEPLLGKRTLLTLMQPRNPLPLIEQLRLPMLDDNLPEVIIRFGDALELRAGSGHELYWIAILPNCPLSFDKLLMQIANSWPIYQVQLDWCKLGYGKQPLWADTKRA